jgi:hypothetical protein
VTVIGRSRQLSPAGSAVLAKGATAAKRESSFSVAGAWGKGSPLPSHIRAGRRKRKMMANIEI